MFEQSINVTEHAHNICSRVLGNNVHSVTSVKIVPKTFPLVKSKEKINLPECGHCWFDPNCMKVECLDPNCGNQRTFPLHNTPTVNITRGKGKQEWIIDRKYYWKNNVLSKWIRAEERKEKKWVHGAENQNVSLNSHLLHFDTLGHYYTLAWVPSLLTSNHGLWSDTQWQGVSVITSRTSRKF